MNNTSAFAFTSPRASLLGKTRPALLAIALLLLRSTSALSAPSPGEPVSTDASTTPLPDPTQKPYTVLLETDPSTFVMTGFALHARLASRTNPGWVFGAGLYGLTLPSLLTDLNPHNRGKDFQARIDTGYGLFTDYHFGGDLEGPFVGVQLAFQRWSVTRDNGPDTALRAEHSTLLLMPRVGYFYKPFANGFYVMPWLGVGGVLKVNGDTTLGADTYHVAPLTGFATVHVGFEL